MLLAREPLGWKLGLERMHRLCSLLGMPQHRFASIHVVGTNGKTSVTRMTAALLQAGGVRTGAYTSPHITDWRERIEIGRDPISGEALSRALQRAEESAAVADRAAGEEGPVTQYELLTAAAFVAFADARVEVAVIEAGLGGRLDATNVIPSRLTVLTSLGLDHTEYLGESLEEIAAEKLAVLRDHTALVTGLVPPEAVPVIHREVQRRHATHAELKPSKGPEPGYPELNSILARMVTELYLGRNLDPETAELALGALSIPGRAQVIEGDPSVVLDAAHNPDGARALVHVLPELAKGREVVGCVAVMADKDADGIVRALAPAVVWLVCTQIPDVVMAGAGRPGARSLPAEQLAELARAAGVGTEAVGDPERAWARARELARQRRAVALATGSHYLLKCM